MKTTGFKQMLRDRVPNVVELALLYCKAKTNWINHVYDNFIKIYSNKDQRYEATRIALGISKKERNFNFRKTILWENLGEYERKYWERITSWVDWFVNDYIYVQNEYKILSMKHDENYIKQTIMMKFHIEEHLYNYLIEHFKKEL